MSKVFKAVGNAVSGVAKAVGSIVGGVVNAVGGVISGVLNFVISPFLGLFGLGMPSLPDTATPESLKGVMVQRNGSDVNIPVVYGYRKVAGTVVFAETGSDTNKYLWVAYVMSEGPVEGLYEVWLDNTQLPSTIIPALNRGERVTVTGKDSKGADCKFNNLTQLQFYSGSYYNNPASTTVGTTTKNGIFSGSPSFTDSMNFNGLATVFARYEWPSDTTNNPFGGSIPKLEVCMMGRKIARLTSGSPELYEWGQFASGYTQSYSTNPAEILLDYLRNPYYGKGLTNNDIDWQSFKQVAAKCDQQVTFINGVTGPILRLDYVVNTGSSIFNNCKDMLSNFRSYLPYTNGKYKLIVEDAGNPTDITSGSAPIAATFTKDNIIGEITYTGIDRASKYNTVTVNYLDPGNQWSTQSVTYPESFAGRQALIAADGGREYTGDFTFAGITNPGIAKDFARLILNKSRYQDAINLTVSSQAFELEPGDNIYIDSNILKFGTDPLENAIPWRIISIKLNNDYTFTIGCVRNPDFIYPHVRQGEIDYKYALYVPKGATRYYPPEPIGIPVGYKPPTYAPILDNDPNNPPPSTGVGKLVDIADLYNIKANVRSGLIYLSATFNQPNNNSYASTIIRYKQNVTTVTTWTQIEDTQKPGANQPVNIEIGPLTNNTQYYLTTLVKYSTGDVSTLTKTYTINIAEQLSTTTTPGTGGGSTTPITPPTPAVNGGDNYFSYTFSQTVTSSSLPLSTRQVNFVLKQDMSAGVNPKLDGLEIFYKPSINPKWYRSTLSLTTTQGNDIPFTLTLGSRLYPGVPGSGGVPADADDYDFIFRFTYSDGKTSQYQIHATNCSVERSGSTYSFSPLSTGTVNLKELTSSYTPQVMDTADIPDTRSLNLGIKSIRNSISTNKIYFNFNSPTTADLVNWKGVRLYSHVAGALPNTWAQDDYALTYDNVVGAYFIDKTITYNTAYEYVIVPLVEYGGTVEATNGRYISGSINNSSGSIDWAPLMNILGNEPVATAKARIGSAPASAPVRTTLFSTASAQPVLSGGFPMNPRKLTFSFSQTVVPSTPNTRLAGIKIYYKKSIDAYYYETTYPLPGGYTEGTTLTFDSTQTSTAMSLGARNYPASLPSNDNYQTYDFIFRWYYDDGTDSESELNFTAVRGRSCAIERCSGSYNFQVLGATGTTPGASYPTTGSITTAKTNISTTKLINQAPGTVSVVTDITDTITAYTLDAAINTPGQIRFFGSTPAAEMATYFRGYKVYYRQITVGQNTAYNTTSDTTIVYEAVNVNGSLKSDGAGVRLNNVTWDVEYEFAFVPQVLEGTVVVNATKCFYVRGRFHNRTTEKTGTNPYPSYENWLSRYPAQKVNTATALSTISNYPAQLTTPPYVQKVTSTRLPLGGNGAVPSLKYYRLQFTIPASTTFNLYRRSVCLATATAKAYDELSLWGYGQWEKIEAVAGTNYTIDGNNLVTMNVRPAISGLYEFYSGFYWASANNAGTNPLYANPASTTDTAVKKLVGDAGTVGYYSKPTFSGPIGAETTQFLIVIKYNNGVSVVESSKATLFNASEATVSNTVVFNGSPIDFSQTTYNDSKLATVISPLPSGIDASAVSSNINNMKRTISEARGVVSAANIKLNSDNVNTYTLPTASPTVQ